MRIGLFGGSFNPPHVGHVLAATYAMAVGRLDELWVVPTLTHAFGKELLPIWHRHHMCQHAFKGLEKVEVLPAIAIPESPYTVDLVEELHSRLPQVTTWVLIVGTDCMQERERWHRWEDLSQMAELLEVPRGGYTPGTFIIPEVSSTQIRGLLNQGNTMGLSRLVPSVVLDYLKEHTLFLL